MLAVSLDCSKCCQCASRPTPTRLRVAWRLTPATAPTGHSMRALARRRRSLGCALVTTTGTQCLRASAPATMLARRRREPGGDTLAACRAVTHRPTSGRRTEPEPVAARPAHAGWWLKSHSPVARSRLNPHVDARKRRRLAQRRSRLQRTHARSSVAQVTKRRVAPWTRPPRRWCRGRNGSNCRGTPTGSTGCEQRTRKVHAKSHRRRRMNAPTEASTGPAETGTILPRPTGAGVATFTRGDLRRPHESRRRCCRLVPTRHRPQLCTSWQSAPAAVFPRHAPPGTSQPL